MKESFYYSSSDGLTQIHAICWQPEGNIRGILQIVHGMQEYIDRYDDFATFLNKNGICVVGEDHLGHGESVVSSERLGYFAIENGNECVLTDIHTLQKQIAARYPDIPYFMLGHSMGSFLTRQYIQRHGAALSGAIIMGSGTKPDGVLWLAKTIAKTIARFHGWDYRSAFLDNLACGPYNKKFEPARTKHDWLSRNTENIDKYEKDPWCMFMFTLNAYYNMFVSIGEAKSESLIAKIPDTLPILVTSGAEDPVGDFGKGTRFVHSQYQKRGIKDLQMKLYPGDRHEILNEVDKDIVYGDILSWLEQRIIR